MKLDSVTVRYGEKLVLDRRIAVRTAMLIFRVDVSLRHQSRKQHQGHDKA